MEAIRILQVIGYMGNGGAQAMLMNLYRQMDRSKIQFDFVVRTKEREMYDDEIEALGGRIWYVRELGIGNVFSYCRWWNSFFAEHPEYKIVHGHCSGPAAIYLSAAKRADRATVAHSHATKNATVSIRSFIRWIISFPTRYIADSFFACSHQAAIDQFGARVADSESCSVLRNAIDLDRFTFDPSARERIRNELKLDGYFVVGLVGRFYREKNHVFLIDVFAEVYKRDPNARLLLVGGGVLEDELRKRCEERGVEQAVVFAGEHANVEDYYAAMDVFCFPSLHEGLGMVAVEAQTNGLPCVASDVVPREADIGAGLYHPVSLHAASAEWAEVILEQKAWDDRTEAVRYAQEAGYDIRQTAKELQAFYLSLIRETKEA